MPTLVHFAYRATEANIAVLSTYCQPHRKRVTSITGVAKPFEIHLTTEAPLHTQLTQTLIPSTGTARWIREKLVISDQSAETTVSGSLPVLRPASPAHVVLPELVLPGAAPHGQQPLDDRHDL